MKRCPTCKGLKPIVDFYRRQSGPRSGSVIPSCKSCQLRSAKDYARRKAQGQIKPRRTAMVGKDHRRCCSCNQVKPLTEFYICKKGEARGKPQAKCKPCNKAACQHYTKSDKWKLRSKELKRKERIESYGITEEQYEAMERRQKGLCAICKRKPSHILRIDHNHKSGSVRGLLCLSCNATLGWVERYYAGIEAYLLKHGDHPRASKGRSCFRNV